MIPWEKIAFSTNVAGMMRYPYAKEANPHSYFASHIKINVKWIIDLKVRAKTTNFQVRTLKKIMVTLAGYRVLRYDTKIVT